MRLNYINILLLIMSMCFSSSCNETLYTISNIYIENPTDKEYLIYLDYYHKDKPNLLNVVLPNTSKQIIDTYLSVNDITERYGGLGNYYVWIYDKADSIHIKVSDDELLIGPCSYGRFEVDYSKQKDHIVSFNAYFTINDSLLVKMTKNTQLTDSIFRIRKLK